MRDFVCTVPVKNYAVPKMSVVTNSFVPLLLSHQVHPVLKQHTRLLIDTEVEGILKLLLPLVTSKKSYS